MSDECYHMIFIDDDGDFLQSMEMALSSKLDHEMEGVEIETHFINSPEEGIDFAEELTEEGEQIAVVVSDQMMPGMTGIDFLEKISVISPKAVKMLLTGYASLDSAKYAINNRILDQYISKPIEDYDNFLILVNNAVETYHLRQQKDRAEVEIKGYIKELEESNRKIRNFHRAAEKIAFLAQGFKKLDLEEVFDLITYKLPSIFNAKYSSLFILNSEDNTLTMVKSNYLEEKYKQPMEAQSTSPMMVALRENRVIIVSEVSHDPKLEFMHKKILGNSCIVIPFVVGGKGSTGDILGNTMELKGVLNLGNISDMDSEEIIQYSADLIKNIMGINILNANLYQQTTHMALIDSLTGLYNKFVFLEFLRKACIYSERHKTPFYLAIFDIDDFKVINDTYGHLAGDEVLNKLGTTLQGFARRSDIISRFGGEEFAWIIHGQNVDDVKTGLERIRATISNSEYSKGIKVTISIGLTSYVPDTNETMDTIIERADHALYQAKSNGKNRVEVMLKDE